jgi:uncharacterized protein YutE (UPF0331/DUF86 family)
MHEPISVDDLTQMAGKMRIGKQPKQDAEMHVTLKSKGIKKKQSCKRLKRLLVS